MCRLAAAIRFDGKGPAVFPDRIFQNPNLRQIVPVNHRIMPGLPTIDIARDTRRLRLILPEEYKNHPLVERAHIKPRIFIGSSNPNDPLRYLRPFADVISSIQEKYQSSDFPFAQFGQLPVVQTLLPPASFENEWGKEDADPWSLTNAWPDQLAHQLQDQLELYRCIFGERPANSFPMDIFEIVAPYLSKDGDYLCRKRGPYHEDGVGILAFVDTIPLYLHRSRSGAHWGGHYQQIADKMHLANHTNSHVVITHLRRGSQGAVLSENVHPFYWLDHGKGIAGAHSGDLQDFKNLLPLHAISNGRIRGATDSEHQLRFLAEKVSAKHGTGDVDAFKNGLAEGIAKIVQDGNWYFAIFVVADEDHLALYSAANYDRIDNPTFSRYWFEKYGRLWAHPEFWPGTDDQGRRYLKNLTIASQSLPYYPHADAGGWEMVPDQTLVIIHREHGLVGEIPIAVPGSGEALVAKTTEAY